MAGAEPTEGVWFNEHVALKANYRFEETTPSFRGPLTYKSYCQALLNKKFWGDEGHSLCGVPACGISGLQSLNSHTDEEYRICHNAIMDQADVNLVPEWWECITALVVSGHLSVVSGCLYSIFNHIDSPPSRSRLTGRFFLLVAFLSFFSVS